MTGPNGLPVATRARPPVQASRSAGVASDRVVGLDMGRMTGRSTCVAISRTIRSVKAPCWEEVPMRMVGCTRPTTSSRPVPHTQIERVLEQLWPVGADIQNHRQGADRVDAARRGVDGELAGRDVDAAGAPVADTGDG